MHLADFLKTKLTKFAVISEKRRQKAVFLSPRSSKITETNKQQQQQLYSLDKNTKVEQFAPQIAGKLVVAGQDKYISNTII